MMTPEEELMTELNKNRVSLLHGDVLPKTDYGADEWFIVIQSVFLFGPYSDADANGFINRLTALDKYAPVYTEMCSGDSVEEITLATQDRLKKLGNELSIKKLVQRSPLDLEGYEGTTRLKLPDDTPMSNRPIGWTAADEIRGYKVWTDEPIEEMMAGLMRVPDSPLRLNEVASVISDAELKQIAPSITEIAWSSDHNSLELVSSEELSLPIIGAIASATNLEFQMAIGGEDMHYFIFEL